MKYKKRDIAVGNYIALGNKPWFISAYYRGEDKRTVDYMRNKQISSDKSNLEKPTKKRTTNHDAFYLKRRIKMLESTLYYKVTSSKKLQHLYRPWGTKCVFKMKWVTDVCKNYTEVMQKGGRR